MKKYDLIVSLGGSCATSLNLRRRGLQYLTFPFDWLFHIDETQYIALKIGFKNNFKNWFEYNNLKKLKKKERGNGQKYQYKDLATNFRYIHDFAEKSKSETYKEVKEKYIRRYNRLLDFIKKSKKILLISDNDYSPSIEIINHFLYTLKERFPKKKFHIIILYFDKKNKKLEKLNISKKITLYKINRNRCTDDYYKNLKEWDFLNNIKLSLYGLYLQNQIKSKFKYFLKKLRKKTRKFRYKIRDKIKDFLKF